MMGAALDLILPFSQGQKQTLDYLCIQPDEIRNTYMKLKL